MNLRRFAFFLSCSFASAPVWGQADLSSEQIEFFEKKIRPVLAESCYECHNSINKKKGDLALDYRAPMVKSGVIVPGNPDESPLIIALRHEGDEYEPMPSKAPKLAKLIIKNFEDWVRMGAPDPRLKKPTKEELAGQVDWNAVRDKRAEWWSFQPVRKTTPPPSNNQEWNRTAIDRFLLASLEKEGLKPQKKASAGTLLRRLHLILTGLPPKPEVVREFVANPSDEAYAEMVDELIASKAYGERWGRYWMDWFRYAESYGSEGDPNVPYATQYRDYVIRAMNEDVPYNQLIREAIAGDLLEKPRVNEELGVNESAIGPAHLRMVPHGFGVTDTYDEQITFTDNAVDVMSKSMLGLTVSCARCHNHKFDPISQKDFYKFYGIMVSSRPAIVNIDSPALQELHKKELKALKKEVRQAFAGHWLKEAEAAIKKLDGAKLDKIADTDPLAGWAKLQGLEPAALKAELTKRLGRHYEGVQHNERVKEKATFYADLRDQETYRKWFQSGNGLEERVSPAGSFAFFFEGSPRDANQGKGVIAGIYPRGVYSHLLSDKHSATINSVFHRAKGARNSIRAVGLGSMARFTLRSYPLMHGGLHPAQNLRSEPRWLDLRKYKYWNGEKGYYQINTEADTTYRDGGNPRSWFGLYEVYAGDESMRELGAPMVSLPGKLDNIRDRESLLAFYDSSLRQALDGWSRGTVTDSQALLIDAFRKRGFLSSELDRLPAKLKGLVESYRKLEAEIRPARRAPGVMEGEPWDQPLLARGSYKEEKEAVPRGFLEVFGGRTYSSGSGRRELAEDMVSEKNTLVARVLVNRLWHHTFGRGLVASADNFGRLGKEPTHPELLDYLAADFRENGWSMKRMVRQMVMSRAFRSDSISANGDQDPENLLLSYYTPRRLDAEAILDTIRFVAANEARERAIYTRAKRNGLNRFLVAFNYPIPTSTVGVRNLTNVPAQALLLMNGDTTKQAARQWSDRVKGNAELKTDEERINNLFYQAYSRPATAQEMELCLSYLKGKLEDEVPKLTAKQVVVRSELEKLRAARLQVIDPVRARLQQEVDARNAEAEKDGPKQVDLKPLARWDFEGGLKDSVGNMHGEVKGGAKVLDGALFLRGGGMWTKPLSKDLKAMSLEVVVELDSLSQREGGAMVVQSRDGNEFDGVIYAEEKPKHWLSGSDRHARTAPFEGAPAEETAHKKAVRMIFVYHADGTVSGYRDGKSYGRSFQKTRPVYRKGSAHVVFGMRHGLSPRGDRALTGRILEACLYDRALSAEEVAAATTGKLLEILTDAKVAAALNSGQKEKVANLDQRIQALQAENERLENEISNVRQAQSGAGDPYYRIAHALLNSKELIYVY